MYEKFEDTKEVINICENKTDRQHNDQKKEDKTTNNNPLSTTHKTEEQHQPLLKPGVNLFALAG